MSKVTSRNRGEGYPRDMNKIEVSFPSSDPSCHLYGDLYLPSSTQKEESLLLPVIVIIAGSGVSPYTIFAVFRSIVSFAILHILCTNLTHCNIIIANR